MTKPFSLPHTTHQQHTVDIAECTLANTLPLAVIAGPCAIESSQLASETAGHLTELCRSLGMPFIYKSSFDKANRSSHTATRGVGFDAGLKILSQVKDQYKVPIITDVHEDTPFNEVASVVDIMQTPAFLCRQTNFMQKVARCGMPVNVKKGQFLSPWEMKNVLAKMTSVGNKQILLCERGASFGYNNLVSDPRSIAVLKSYGYPVVFDATHSVQLPGGQGTASGGMREFVPTLAKAAVANGIAAVFIETHPNPPTAASDGANAWPLSQMKELLDMLQQIDRVAKKINYEYY